MDQNTVINPLTFWRSVLLCITVMLVAFICALLLTLILPDLSVKTAIWANIPGFAAGIILGAKITGIPYSVLFKCNRISYQTSFATLIGSIGIVLIMAELDNYIFYYLPMPLEFIDLFETLITGSTGFFAVVLMAPLTEELFFRGVIFKGLSLNYKPFTAVCLSALLFGVIHLNPWQLIPAFCAGIFIGWVYFRTGNILLCIFIHALNNGLAYFMQVLDVQVTGLSYDIREGAQFLPLWLTVLGGLLLAAGIQMLNRETHDAV